MNEIDLYSGRVHAVYTEQNSTIEVPEKNDSTLGFFVVGIVINVVLVSVYLIWACRQWGKTSNRDK